MYLRTLTLKKWVQGVILLLNRKPLVKITWNTYDQTFSPLSDGRWKTMTVRNDMPTHGMIRFVVWKSVFRRIVMLNVISGYGVRIVDLSNARAIFN